MALAEKISKSALIRKAIKAYQKNLEKQRIIKLMQDSARREIADGRMFEEMKDFDNALLMNGLEDEPNDGWFKE